MRTRPIQEDLVEHGFYVTPTGDDRPKPEKCLARFDLCYHWELLKIVFGGYGYARRGAFTPDVWCHYATATLNLIERSGGTVEITDFRKASQPSSPYVLAANHMSLLETFVLPSFVLPLRGVATVVKESLLSYPFFGPILRQLKPIAVTRSRPRDDLQTVLTEGAQALKDGRTLLIFPQATRSVTFDCRKFNTLAVKIARRASVPVVPVALRTDFMGLGWPFKDFGPIHRDEPVRFRFGDPVTVGTSEKAAHRECLRFIVSSLKEWGIPVVNEPET